MQVTVAYSPGPREVLEVWATERAYRTTVPQGAKPSLLLYINVPPGDVEALSRAISLLLTDPARRLALGESAAARANAEALAPVPLVRACSVGRNFVHMTLTPLHLFGGPHPKDPKAICQDIPNRTQECEP